MSRVLTSHVDPASAEFAANEAEHARLSAELRERLRRAALGGGEKARARPLERGKLLPRDRVDRLLDPGSPFLELAPLAAEDLYGGARPGAGTLARAGRVEGRGGVL